MNVLIAIAATYAAISPLERTSASERTRVPLLVISATAPLPEGFREPELIAAADAAVRSWTKARISTAEQSGLDARAMAECPIDRLFTCWALAVSRAHEDIPLLLAVSLDEAEIGLAALDARIARDLLEGARDPEKQIFERAVIATKARSKIEAADLARYFESTLRGELRPALARAELDTALGRVTIALPAERLVIALDGRPIATPSSRAIAIDDVPPGAHAIRVDDPTEALAPFETRIELAAGAEVALEVPRVEVRRDVSSPVIYGVAVATAIAGGTLIAYGAAAAPNARVSVACPEGCPSESERTFASFCELSADRPASCGAGGLAPVPLGLGLAAFGAGSAGTTYFLSADSGERVWLPWIVGAALGASLFAASTALGR